MQAEPLSITTDAIGENGIFDPRYTCDSDNSSPELRWENPPPNTKGFALVAEDRNMSQGVFTHWLIYNIPPNVHHLPAGIPPQESLPNGIHQGINSLGKLGYAGPCPPEGDTPHRYFFRLFALREQPKISLRAHREELFRSIETLILAEAQIVGLYQRIIHRVAG